MRQLIILLVTLLLTGCAGLHNMPPDNYSETDDSHTIRVFFDQNGELYPESPAAKMPNQVLFGRNKGFSIQNHMRQTGQTYTEDSIENHYQKISSKIDNTIRLNENLKLVMLVHGFNNSYLEAKMSFQHIKEFLETREGREFLFIEVYWDGLYKGPFSSPLPFAYWFNSLTYSNIAGQVGLRRLVNRLPPSTELNIITHSRGAGVAFSVFANPIYDDDIEQPEFEDLKINNLSSVKIVTIAPAIGNGHPIGELGTNLPEESAIFVGFNANDPDLNKKRGSVGVDPSNFGDTSLGCDDEFFLLAKKTAQQNGLELKRVKYKQYKSHSLRGYINKSDDTECLFWAAGLLSKEPEECTLE